MEMRFFFILFLFLGIGSAVFSADDASILESYHKKDYPAVIKQISSKDKGSEHLILKTLSHIQLKQFDLARATYSKLRHSDHLGHYDAMIKLMINQDQPFLMSRFDRLFSNLPSDPTPNYVIDIWLTYLERAVQSKNKITSGYLAYRIPFQQVPASAMSRYVELMVKYQAITSDNIISIPSFYPFVLKYPQHFTASHLSRRVLARDREAVIETLTQRRDLTRVQFLLNSWAQVTPSGSFDLLYGKALYQLKQYDEALLYFNRIPTNSEEYFDAYYYMTKNEYRNKRYPEALMRLETLLSSTSLPTASRRQYLELAYDCISAVDPSGNILAFVEARHMSKKDLPNSFLPRLGVESYHLQLFDDAFDYFRDWVPTEDTDRAKRLYFLHRCEINLGKKPLSGYGSDCFYTYPDSVYAAMLANQGEFDFHALLDSGYELDLKPPEDVVVLLNSGFAPYLLDEVKARISAAPKFTAEKDVLSGAWIFQKIGQYGAAMRLLLSNGYPLHTKDKGICKSFTQYYYPRPHWAIVQLEALERNINPNFSLAIMREESTFNPQAKSGSGAMGLMQLMPKTAEGIAKSLKISKFHTRDLYKPETNIQFGSYYLGFLSRKFNAHPLWMAAGYNAGPNAAQRWKDRWLGASDEVILERIPYPETNAYAKRVLRSFFIYSLLAEEGADTVSSKPSNTTHQ